MAVLRIRHPKTPSRDVPLGELPGRLHDFRSMRLPLDVAFFKPKRVVVAREPAVA